MTGRLTTNIQKGGALLADARRLAEVWNLDEPADANLARIVQENLLGKASRSRAEDVLNRILRPRLIDPGPQVIAALKLLTDHPSAFVTACYYEAGRDDELLAAFVEGPLASRHEAGLVSVSTHDTISWLQVLEKDGRVAAWSDNVRTKVARGLLASLRDFSILTGSVYKEIRPAPMTIIGFAYVAFRLHEQGASSRSLVTSPVWRWWFLNERQVDGLLRQAEHAGLLRYAAAGSIARVDWLIRSLPEVARAVE